MTRSSLCTFVLAAAALGASAVGASGCAQNKGPIDPSTAQPPDPLPGKDIALPLKPDSVRFAVIGDSGTGGPPQFEIARILTEARAKFPFEFVIMLGDNLYLADTPVGYRKAFEEPYKDLLAAGVKFYAALGNHDNPNQRFYKLFNMGGERYYTFKPKPGVRFFALDSNYVSPEQVAWLQKELAASGSDWKIAFFHHPLYSSGERYGPAVEIREILEPIFVKHGVNVVFAGHEHFYERLKPQKGVYYFTSGSAAKLRPGNIRKAPETAKGFDSDYSFMLLEVGGDEMYFQTISRRGRVVDSGILNRQEHKEQPADAAKPATPSPAPSGPGDASADRGAARPRGRRAA